MTRLLLSCLALLATLAGFAAHEAKAAFPCTWAPGEVQVGDDRGVPLCEQRGVPSDSSPVYLSTNYYAVAWHSDATDVWMVAGYSSAAAAEQSVMRQCNAAMGKGCTLAQSSYNGAVAIVKGMNGRLFSSTDSSRKGAERGAMDYCKEQTDICSPIGWMMAPAGNRTPQSFPPAGNYRHVYATAAWPQESTAATLEELSVHVSSGHASAAAAEQGALEFCQSQTGVPCVVVRTIASTHFIFMTQSDDRITVTSSPTDDLVKKVAKDRCPKGLKCKITAVVPSWRGGNMIHSPFAEAKKK